MNLPLRALVEFLNRMPAVEALRSLRLAEAVSVGVGRYKRGDHEKVVDRWRKTARPLERARTRARRRPLTREEKIALLEGPSDVPSLKVVKVSAT